MEGYNRGLAELFVLVSASNKRLVGISGWRLRLEKSERHLVIFEVCLSYIGRNRAGDGVSLDITGDIH